MGFGWLGYVGFLWDHPETIVPALATLRNENRNSCVQCPGLTSRHHGRRHCHLPAVALCPAHDNIWLCIVFAGFCRTNRKLSYSPRSNFCSLQLKNSNQVFRIALPGFSRPKPFPPLQPSPPPVTCYNQEKNPKMHHPPSRNVQPPLPSDITKHCDTISAATATSSKKSFRDGSQGSCFSASSSPPFGSTPFLPTPPSSSSSLPQRVASAAAQDPLHAQTPPLLLLPLLPLLLLL